MLLKNNLVSLKEKKLLVLQLGGRWANILVSLGKLTIMEDPWLRVTVILKLFACKGLLVVPPFFFGCSSWDSLASIWSVVQSMSLILWYEIFWQLREAVLYALGSLSEQLLEAEVMFFNVSVFFFPSLFWSVPLRASK